MSPGTGTHAPSTVRCAGLPEVTGVLARYFASRSIEAYVVGGALRDALLDRRTDDLDLAAATDVRVTGPHIAASLGGTYVPLDEARGIVRVVAPAKEGTSTIDISRLDAGIEEDLRRRDFTVDAMALPLHRLGSGDLDRHLIDPLAGQSDLESRVVRAASPGAFAADPARLMRAPRLAAQLGFVIDEATVTRIRADARLLSGVAPERTRDELLKLLAELGATGSLRLLDELDLLCRVLPELSEARGVTQPREHHWDVFGHLVETPGQVERVIGPRPGHAGFIESETPGFDGKEGYFAAEVSDGHSRRTLVKLAGLLHDVSKPATRTVEESGRIRFIGHHTEGAEVAEAVLDRLRLSRRGVELVALMVRYHLRPSQMAQRDEMPSGKAVYRYFRDVGDASVDTLFLNLADYLAARGPALGRDEWVQHCRLIGHILREGLERKAPEVLPKLVTGHDIMDVLRLGSGPRVGAILREVAEAVANGQITTRDEALELARANLEMRGTGA